MDTQNHEPMPGVTVAVCVWNGESTIAACLDSLMQLEYPDSRLNILVVDNGSTDRTPMILSRYPVTVIQEPRRGRGYARNTAWQNCTDDLIAFTDADCVVCPDWLSALVPVFSDETIGCAGGPIVTRGDTPLARFYESRQIVSNKEFSGNYPFSPPFLATANAIFRISALNACQGFNTDYIVAEDADVSWRIQDHGFGVKYVEAGTVFHHHRATLGSLFRQSLDYGYDGVHVFLRHRSKFPSRRWLWWGLYARFIASLLRLPLSILQRDPGVRMFPLFDAVRYSGLILGRLRAAAVFHTLIV